MKLQQLVLLVATICTVQASNLFPKRRNSPPENTKALECFSKAIDEWNENDVSVDFLSKSETVDKFIENYQSLATMEDLDGYAEEHISEISMISNYIGNVFQRFILTPNLTAPQTESLRSMLPVFTLYRELWLSNQAKLSKSTNMGSPELLRIFHEAAAVAAIERKIISMNENPLEIISKQVANVFRFKNVKSANPDVGEVPGSPRSLTPEQQEIPFDMDLLPYDVGSDDKFAGWLVSLGRRNCTDQCVESGLEDPQFSALYHMQLAKKNEVFDVLNVLKKYTDHLNAYQLKLTDHIKAAKEELYELKNPSVVEQARQLFRDPLSIVKPQVAKEAALKSLQNQQLALANLINYLLELKSKEPIRRASAAITGTFGNLIGKILT